MAEEELDVPHEEDCVCRGSGWVTRSELPDTSDWDGTPDDTRYSCTYIPESYERGYRKGRSDEREARQKARGPRPDNPYPTIKLAAGDWENGFTRGVEWAESGDSETLAALREELKDLRSKLAGAEHACADILASKQLLENDFNTLAESGASTEQQLRAELESEKARSRVLKNQRDSATRELKKVLEDEESTREELEKAQAEMRAAITGRIRAENHELAALNEIEKLRLENMTLIANNRSINELEPKSSGPTVEERLLRLERWAAVATEAQANWRVTMFPDDEREHTKLLAGTRYATPPPADS